MDVNFYPFRVSHDVDPGKQDHIGSSVMWQFKLWLNIYEKHSKREKPKTCHLRSPKGNSQMYGWGEDTLFPKKVYTCETHCTGCKLDTRHKSIWNQDKWISWYGFHDKLNISPAISRFIRAQRRMIFFETHRFGMLLESFIFARMFYN